MSAATLNDGGPAFPNLAEQSQSKWPESGLSIRDYFAAKAMQSVLQTSWRDLDLKPKNGLSVIENSAVFAYEIADAMLKAKSW